MTKAKTKTNACLNLGAYYQLVFLMPRKQAAKIARQRAEKDEIMRGNKWNIFDVKIGRESRVCHLIWGGNDFYKFHDLEANKEVLIMKNAVSLSLVEMGRMVGLTRRYEYAEVLVYGKPASKCNI